MRELPRYSGCFICGKENPCGAGVTWWETNEGSVQGSYLTSSNHSGFEGVMHGGVLTGLLDECIGWAIALRYGVLCFTGELKVRFLKPVLVGREVVIRGRCAGEPAEGKKYFPGDGEILDADEKVYASCEAKFFPMPLELQSAVLAKLTLRGGSSVQSIESYLWPERHGK